MSLSAALARETESSWLKLSLAAGSSIVHSHVVK